MALNSPSESVKSYAKTCLDYADRVGDILLQKFPESLTSRPVLLWTIMKSAISIRARKDEHGRDNPLSFSYLQAYPGYQRETTICIGIPYYVPIHKENPGWKPPQLPEKCSKLVEMALETAKEHDDFKLQVLCLQELSMRSQSPSSLLNELAELQKTRQLDMTGYLGTCLTKYLICSDEDSARRLRMELSDVDQWHHPSELLSVSKTAARDIIRQALLPSSDEGPTLSINAGLEYYQHLDQYRRDIIDRYVPRPSDGRDPRDFKTLSRPDPDASPERERGEMMQKLAETRQLNGELRSSTSRKDKDPMDDAAPGQDRSFETSTPQVRKRPSERRGPTGGRGVPHIPSAAAGDWARGPQEDFRENGERKGHSSIRNTSDMLGISGHEILRDRHGTYTQHAARPRLAISAPPEQPDLGPTVEEVSDQDQRQRPEVESGSETEPDPSGEWRSVDAASRPTWKESIFRPRSVERVERAGPRSRSPSPMDRERFLITRTRVRSRSSRSPTPTPETRQGIRHNERRDRSSSPSPRSSPPATVERIRTVVVERERDRSPSPVSSHTTSHDPMDVQRGRLDNNELKPSPQPSPSPAAGISSFSRPRASSI